MCAFGPWDISLLEKTEKVYASVDHYVSWQCLGALTAAEQEFMESILVWASREIDADTNRPNGFYPSSTAEPVVEEARVYSGPGRPGLVVDLISVSAITLDGVALSAGAAADYVLRPGRPREGWPYTSVLYLAATGGWPVGVDNIEITGVFGWECVPENVFLSCLNRVKEVYERRHRESIMREFKTGSQDYSRFSSEYMRKMHLNSVRTYARAEDHDEK